MWGRSLYFECNVCVVEDVPREPNCAEMTPAEFLNYNIAIDQDLADVHRVITTDFVISETFIFRAIRVFVALN